MEYKKSLGEHYTTGFQTKTTAKWSAVAVIRILTNEVYTGVSLLQFFLRNAVSGAALPAVPCGTDKMNLRHTFITVYPPVHRLLTVPAEQQSGKQMRTRPSGFRPGIHFKKFLHDPKIFTGNNGFVIRLSGCMQPA